MPATARKHSTPAPNRDAIIFWYSLTALWLSILLWRLVHDLNVPHWNLIELLPWLIAYILTNLIPVPLSESRLAPDFPITVAGALLLSPVQIGLVSFLGAFDQREFRRQISVGAALFNRSQCGLASFLAGLVAQILLREPAQPQWLIAVAVVALGTAISVNHFFVATSLMLMRGYSLSGAARRMKLAAPIDLVMTFVAWALLGAILALVYRVVQAWALAAFVAVAVLGRQVLAKSQMFLEARRARRLTQDALVDISSRIHEERSDERRLIAADLHDEVLQPLYKVSLMSHVLKADLASGKLLDLDRDLPDLLAAAEMASETLRSLIGDLRRSTLGRGGLTSALASLVAALRKQSAIRIRSAISEVDIDPSQELVVYQIAKEAIGNAISHSRASTISVELRKANEEIEFVIEDDGIGFDPLEGKEGHFGLHIMNERAASIGALLSIDSFPGHGCKVLLCTASN